MLESSGCGKREGLEDAFGNLSPIAKVPTDNLRYEQLDGEQSLYFLEDPDNAIVAPVMGKGPFDFVIGLLVSVKKFFWRLVATVFKK